MIIVQKPNGDRVETNFPEETTAKTVVRLFRSQQDSARAQMYTLDKEETDDNGNRVIVLKTNAGTKG
ncbi:hypothetical protein KQH40_00750 [bacterium]|nr:hypothetical protein [bacterium]